ncbi:hypothetical protein BW723_13130 [Polaribacter reichenbachii]|uniref:DUF2254 domain-containing protein n=1 Tax=Polaribacter reichenbachii TaxID=996801 RepID=A0A1B8TZX6_9FLAO|nr:DUF2254 domain-containing protein [Polaribacter reichenbachii]APZ47168.1 hypothetical protein BW723_13130 [Polaribacter reichenbachii]AUC17808.1 hypothetical protein BTO17_03575 [Polaribacter reichenbachii]OBY65168.1 hypothetical protein LPB301_08650 [Polaribacter reichenbachii]
MKDKFLQIFRKIYHLKDKIAFFPTIISIAGALFAYLMMFAENKGISKYLVDFLPGLVINNIETARVILSSFIGGLISIMVFSFSMVMILLNQASSNFSPRLLPGLISNRKHQIILGIYLATILYCIFILVFIEPTGSKYQVPGFSVLLSIVFMVCSLGAFIYFIHSISQEIQIEFIMNRIGTKAKKKLEKLLELEENEEFEFSDSSNWKSFKVKETNYFQDVSLNILKKVALDNDCKLHVISKKGSLCFKDEILFKTEKDLDEKTIEKIYKAFDFSNEEFIEDNYLIAFKHLKEIALKAMSPGINDPGTASYAIDYLHELFKLRIQKQENDFIFHENNCIILLDIITFKDLIYKVMASLRNYTKHDVIIVKKLLQFLKDLKNYTSDKEKLQIIDTEIENLLKDAKSSISNNYDYDKLSEI